MNYKKDKKTYYYKHKSSIKLCMGTSSMDNPNYVEIDVDEFNKLKEENNKNAEAIALQLDSDFGEIYNYEHEKKHLSGFLKWDSNNIYLHRDGSDINRRPLHMQYELIKDDPTYAYWIKTS